MTVLDFEKMKNEKRKISMVTCYDFWSARIIDQSAIDCVLVGDSLAMVMHGFSSTVHASTEMMVPHVQAVARGSLSKFIIADMPFLTFRKSEDEALKCVDLLMKAGAHGVKLEGVQGHEGVIKKIVESGVPVMGHLGLTPQSINGLGGFKIQGREKSQADQLLIHAKRLEELGCFSVVLECIPNSLAEAVTQGLTIPTIGIGAGSSCDGQVLVLQDLLGMNPEFKPKFLKTYLDGFNLVRDSLNQFNSEVKEVKFPSEIESYK